MRLRPLALVLLLALAVRTLEPDPGARRAALLLAALGLGYGHQLGAWWFGRKRERPWLEHALRVCTLATAGGVFALTLGSAAAYPAMVVLAALAAWHVFENDRALAHASPRRVGLPPLARGIGAHAPALLATAAAVAVALSAPRVAPALIGAGLPAELAVWTPEEVIALLLLYHVLVFAGRGGAGGRGPQIVAIHGLPVLVLLAIQGLAPAAYAWIASPILYLLASALHAVVTSLDRGLEQPA